MNLLKFISEAGPVDVIDVFAGSYSTSGVIAQLRQLDTRLTEVESRWNDPQATRAVRAYIERLSSTQRAFASAPAQRLKFAERVTVGTRALVLSMATLTPQGETVAEYRVDITQGNAIVRTANGYSSILTREQFLEALRREVFEPIQALDPLADSGMGPG